MSQSRAALIGVSIWRLAVAASAFTGLGLILATGGGFADFAYLTNQGNLATGVVFLVLAGYPLVTGRFEPERRWVRGATALLMILICVTYLTMLGGDLSHLRDQLAHFLTPVLVVVDWVAVGSSQARTRWWYPLTWLLPPLAYLGFYVAYGQRLYGFLDPAAPDFPTVVGSFLVALTAVGFLLYGVARLRGLLVRRAVAPAQ
ncbi:Pr6Pr family membrane protein [Actinocatenispora rupis]|uniref:Uncharacterized protein n=1 Tax=Actinocatenispora rupis TaxID=519421 RepID=A0A8J3IZA2_9ACTN|nr:Pr6Pr family membrane protein [Actinocatenispora rupis]GID11348.1 hypothetical protein Aru02nite_22370 [Actinocatenispora rupis]